MILSASTRADWAYEEIESNDKINKGKILLIPIELLMLCLSNMAEFMLI
jgi:hypothetical protein